MLTYAEGVTDSRRLVVAVDVGGTRVKAALVEADGTPLAERVLPPRPTWPRLSPMSWPTSSPISSPI